MPTNFHIVKAMFFPVVMYGCEIWTINKAEHWEIDAFELWCWRRLLRVPWTARRSNQSILKEISPEYSLEGLMLKLKLQYFGHLMRRTDYLEKTLMLGKIEGRRRRGQLRMRWLNGITNSMEMSLSKLRCWWWTGRPGVLWCMESQRVRHNWATELNWKEINPEYSLKGLMPKLKLQYFGYLIRRDLIKKTVILGKIEFRSRREGQRMRWLEGITNLMDMSFWQIWEIAKDRACWCAAVHVVHKQVDMM